MYLSDVDHASRHVPYKKQIRDDYDNPIGVLPQAFEMREHRGEDALSVNWLEYFGGKYDQNLIEAINDYRSAIKANGSKVGVKSAFAIGSVGKMHKICQENGAPKVRIVHDNKKGAATNKSHSRIIRMPINDLNLMSLFASEVFNDLVRNQDIP